MDSKFIKSHQCSLERFHAVLIEINSKFTQKQTLKGLLVTKIYKNRMIKIYLLNYFMPDYIQPITTSLPP